jgi:Ca-activated chloride channel homolog
MFSGQLPRALLLASTFWTLAVWTAHAQQVFSVPISTNRFGTMTSLDAIQTTKIDTNVFMLNSRNRDTTSPLQAPSGSISKLDLKAPGKARREYEKGYQLLMKKNLQSAIEHLTKSLGIYPSFVAAHNALGTAYLNLGQDQQANDQFAQAVTLDNHLPSSYLNLGCAQLALKQYADAETSLRKASSIAPLDLQLLTALAYAEFLNHDFPAVISTVHQVHDRKHEGAALVHYFAAGAWEAQDNLGEARREMETLLAEDPKSTQSAEFHKILEQIKAEQATRATTTPHPAQTDSTPVRALIAPSAEKVSRRTRQILQDEKEQFQIAEAEASPDPTCTSCGTTAPIDSALGSNSMAWPPASVSSTGPILRVAVDEVAIFFAATDHGKSVSNLAASEIQIHDDNKSPESIVAFRNESELPLRLGLIIDTSNSVTDRFSFEQAAAIKFLNTVVTDNDDLAFVVAVNNSVLVVQDFTADQALAGHAIEQLAPGGGTALWDAVAFAADKLARRPEAQPVARILVVISDGEDNSSSTTLKQAIGKAQQGEVAVYTVSTRDTSLKQSREMIGDHALKALSELTGGSAFMPGSVHGLNGSLADLLQVIRGRYLISYKPASFKIDGRYRPIDIKAEKEGHKLTVYARKGYYASPAQFNSTERSSEK